MSFAFPYKFQDPLVDFYNNPARVLIEFALTYRSIEGEWPTTEY